MRLYACILAVIFLAVPFIASADESFGGSKPLLCASMEANACGPGEACEKSLPEEVGAPQFLRVDFAKQEVVGPKRSTPIRLMEKSDDQIVLQGFELNFGWTLVIDRATGKFWATLANREGAFAIYGACTQL